MDAPGKSACNVGEGELTSSEGIPAVADTTASGARERNSEHGPENVVCVSAGTQDPVCVSPKVPSETSHTSLTSSQMEQEERNLGNLTIVPTVEDIPEKQSAVGLPDLLVESFGSELKNESIASSGNHERISSELVEQLSVNLDKGDNKGKDCSDVCGWISQGESVLPSMGILPEAEEIPTKASQPQISQPTVSSAVAGVQSAEKRSPDPQPVDPSDVVHKIKKIKWQDIEVPIITQNNNGPCPLIAIVNVMILKGQITLPSDRTEITGGELVLVVGNALFDLPRKSLPSEMRRHVEQNTEDAISILHKLLTGLDVNVKFSGVRDFEFTGELCVFDLLGIMLYHGWVIDTSSEAAAIIQDLSYNQLTNNIFAWREEAIRTNNNDLLVKAMLCEEFMTNSGSQLTIHGLFELGSALACEEIAVLFRNNHFSTIYKRGDQLYQLLTDQGFLHENMVWETLNDVDATFSEFVNGNFEPIPPAPEPSSSSTNGAQNMTMQQQISSDQQLAAMLQHEVDLQQQQQQSFERLKDSLGLHNMSDEEIAKKLQEEENRLAAEAEAEANAPQQTTDSPPPQTHHSPQHPPHTQEEKKKKECVIL
ncbi:ubiquitin carboxyl-terminal hydrolase MINDY-1 isoform X1 [Procambarus clarkii]|uniref:ubiquitin carboxyl-terminal hydrolase MINDY-1 isoform X1 n=1 Tax=Procambarus clarkii TaxID=6728 RepID=UPI0037443F36